MLFLSGSQIKIYETVIIPFRSPTFLIMLRKQARLAIILNNIKNLKMDFEDELAECMNTLFRVPDGYEISFFKTTKNNEGLIVNNYMYSLKYSSK